MNFIPIESKFHINSFPFLISNLGSKFTTKFFKCYCVGYMEVANSFGVQGLWYKYICLSLWSYIFRKKYFLRYF